MAIKRKYLSFLQHIDEIKGEDLKKLKAILDGLRKEFSKYNWIGIYVLRNEKLELLVYSGDKETEHKVIPIDKGLCGMAVREKRKEKLPVIDKEGNNMKSSKPKTKSSSKFNSFIYGYNFMFCLLIAAIYK